MAESSDKGKETAAGEKEGDGKKIVINNVIIKDGKLNLAMALLGGKAISAPLPDLHLKDIGKKKGGASPVEAFNEIFSALYAKITSPSVTGTLNKGLKAIGSSLQSVGKGAQKVGKSAKKGLEDVAGKVKGLFN